MPKYDVGAWFQTVASKILTNSQSAMFRIEMKISNMEQSVVVFPLSIHTWNIVHDYEGHYSEGNTMTIDVSVEEAIMLTSVFVCSSSSVSPLEATIVLIRVDEHYHKPLEDVEPQVLKYLVFIPQATDILKALQKSQVLLDVNQLKSPAGDLDLSRGSDEIRAARFDLVIELQVEETFSKHDQPINGLIADTTLDQAVSTIVSALDYKKVQVEKSDNQRQLKHCPIPPMQTLSSALTELQKTFGIYQKGLAIFEQYDSSQEVSLYIYPAYELEPAHPSVELELFKFPEQAYDGAASYFAHNEDKTKLAIMINDKAEFQSLSEVGTEMLGNYHIAKRTDTMIDIDTTRKGREHTVRNNNMMSVAAEQEHSTVTGRTTTRYTEASDNPFVMTSAMSAVMCGFLTASWTYAWPWIIKPNTKCVYYYENEKGVISVNGIVSSVEYTCVVADSIVGLQTTVYGWQAILKVRTNLPVEDSVTDANDLAQYARLIETSQQQQGTSGLSYAGRVNEVSNANPW